MRMPFYLYGYYNWWRCLITHHQIQSSNPYWTLWYTNNKSKTLLNIYFYQQKGAWLRKHKTLYYIYTWKINNNHPFLTCPHITFIRRAKYHFKASQLFFLLTAQIMPLLWNILLSYWTPNKFSKHGIHYRTKTLLFKAGKKSSYMAFKNKFF